MISPIRHRKKQIMKGFKSLDKYFTPEAISAAEKVPTRVNTKT